MDSVVNAEGCRGMEGLGLAAGRLPAQGPIPRRVYLHLPHTNHTHTKGAHMAQTEAEKF